MPWTGTDAGLAHIAGLVAGVIHGGITGLYVGMGAYVFGNLMGVAWLFQRSRSSRQAL